MNNNKIVLRKRTSAIFLAIVLVAGTIAAISPSFIIGEAQAAPYYGMDNNYEKSYGKDNRDKSKDSSKSISINKLKCINTNLNINGNNAGNISIGNKGQGYLGGYSSAAEGYSKQDKGIDCIINNNNNNTNVVASAGGGNVTELRTCEECFETFLNDAQITILLSLGPASNLTEICQIFSQFPENTLTQNLAGAVGADEETIERIIACLREAGFVFA